MDTKVQVSLSICSTELWLLWLIKVSDILLLFITERCKQLYALLLKAVDVRFNLGVDLLNDLLPLLFRIPSSCD